MRQFVCDYIGDDQQLRLRGGVFIDQQYRFSEGDATQVLHRAECEVRHRDQIKLVARIRYAVVVVEESQPVLTSAQRVCREVPFADGVYHSQRGTVYIYRFGCLKRANNERQQIS